MVLQVWQARRVTWPLLLVVWLCWGLSYPFMAWTLEAVDLITARLLANAGAGTLFCCFACAPRAGASCRTARSGAASSRSAC